MQTSQANDTLHAELAGYQRRFAELASEAEELVAPLDDVQLNWSPHPDRWSVGQCLDHLNVVGYQILPRLSEAIRKGHTAGRTANPPFRYGLLSRFFIRANAPAGRKVKTLAAYRPSVSGSLRKEEVLSRFRSLQEELARAAADANTLDLSGIKVTSPASKLIRISLGAWFAATIAHEERHLLQARTVVQRPEFPT